MYLSFLTIGMIPLTLLITALTVEGLCASTPRRRQRELFVKRGESWKHIDHTGLEKGKLPIEDIVKPWRMPKSCSANGTKNDMSLVQGETFSEMMNKTKETSNNLCKNICESYGQTLKKRMSNAVANERNCTTAEQRRQMADCEEMTYKFVWIPGVKKCIYVGNTQYANKTQAERKCKQISMKLLQVENQEVLNAIEPNYLSTYWVYGLYEDTYTTGKDDKSIKVFTKFPSNESWKIGEPCCAIGPHQSDPGKLYFHDYKCDHHGLNYICQF